MDDTKTILDPVQIVVSAGMYEITRRGVLIAAGYSLDHTAEEIVALHGYVTDSHFSVDTTKVR